MARKSKGRQKIEMVKMPNESNLQVTFSKRRSGLFKKASELSTLCGAEIATVVFSPGKKVFSFGHPNVESVIDRYLTGNPPQSSGTQQLIDAHRNASVRELNMQLTQALGQLEAEKKRGEELNKMKRASQSQCWWEAPIEELNMQQLQQLKESLEELKKNAAKQAEKLLIQNSNPSQFFAASSSGGVPPPHFFASSSSGGVPPPQFFASSSSGGVPPPQFFAGSSSGGVPPFDAKNAAGFNAAMLPSHAYNPGNGHGYF